MGELEPEAFGRAVRRRPGGLWRGLLGFALGGALGAPLSYAAAITVSPARTSEGYPTMPIGQAAFALMAGFAIAVVSAWRLGRR